jgi:16S rRNA (guanine(966)-N(2))-methyltransferase RsmD
MRLADSSFLDLFAGSGAVGLEAAGRGAREVLLLEGSRRVARELAVTVQRVAPDVARARFARLPEELLKASAPRCFDLVFADPPYGFDDFATLLEGCSGVLAKSGLVAIEHSSRQQLPAESANLVRIETRRYGESALSFYRSAGEDEEEEEE